MKLTVLALLREMDLQLPAGTEQASYAPYPVLRSFSELDSH
jgi:hypothetical protein